MAFSEDDPKAKLWRDGEELEDSNETKEEEENEDSNETKEEEEIEECGYCTYIKGGECKESFIALQKCVKEEGKSTKCKEVRKIFETCIFENPVYYTPIINMEAKMIAVMISELQAEKEAVLAGSAATIAKALSELQAEKEAVLAGDAAAIAKALSKLKKEPVLPAEIAAIAKAFQDLEADKEKGIAKGNESDHQKTP